MYYRQGPGRAALYQGVHRVCDVTLRLDRGMGVMAIRITLSLERIRRRERRRREGEREDVREE